MNKNVKLISIVLGAFFLIKLVIYFVDLYRQKSIFGGRTKQQFKQIMTENWKEKYFEGMRGWIRLDNPDTGAKNWAYNVNAKAQQNGTTFEKQREITINYLWNQNIDNQLYKAGSNKWNNNWAIDTAKTIGAKTDDPKVIQALSEIHK